MQQVRRGFEILKEDGVFQFLKSSAEYVAPVEYYNNTIWPLLPATSDYGTYNGVEVKGNHPMIIVNAKNQNIQHKLFDGLVPWNTPSSISNFKQPNVKQIHNNYNKGDNIVIIGGGNGVSAVHSAKAVGADGRVQIFEGDYERIRDLKRTLKKNNVYDMCEINHCIVGNAHFVESPGNADLIKPSKLPECDALEMDCEGAELNVLRDITKLPKKMIIELHHEKSYAPYSSSEEIESILVEKGFHVKKYDGPWVDGLFVAVLE